MRDTMTWDERKRQYNEYYFTEYGGHVSEAGLPTLPMESARQWAGFVAEHFGPRSILDCGCATGWLVYGFLHLDSGILAKGCDISDFAIGHSYPEIRDQLTVLDLSEGLPYETDEFDLVTGIDVLEHLQDYNAICTAVEAMCRVSRRAIFLRQPMVRFVGFETIHEIYTYLESLNALPHRARLALVGAVPELLPAIPLPHSKEHPNEHPRDFWIALFEAYGFQERPLPEDVYVFPNLATINSFDALAFEKKGL